MIFKPLLQTSGEQALQLEGPCGPLEAVFTVPEQPIGYVALIGHPHSLQGGTMNNKVVTTLVRAFKELKIPSLRFNFRGVGASAGSYDAGVGESEDMLALAKTIQGECPKLNFFFAGFSFGSYVAYRAAAQFPNKGLLTIAPPVHHYDYGEFKPPSPWLIIQGKSDDVVPLSDVKVFASQTGLNDNLILFEETGHFFHGKLIELREQVISLLQNKVLNR